VIRRPVTGIFMAVAGLIAVTVLAVITFEPVRTGVTTLALVPELLDQGPKVLSVVAPEPARRQIGYGEIRRDRADLYLPADTPAEDAGLHGRPAVILVLGANQVALEHPVVVRTATALARIGFVVAVPADADLAAGRIRPDAVGHLIDAFEAVAGQPEVDPSRVGLAGFSVGASVALLAAADPELAGRVAWVNAFGAYADATTLLVDIASRSITIDAGVQPWQPGELARRAALGLILSAVPNRAMAEVLRAATEPAILDGGAPPAYDQRVAARLDGDATVAYRLLAARTRAEAEAAMADLSPSAMATLAALSPVTVAGAIRAPVFLMHDVGDDAIPVTHLAHLAGAIPATSLRRTTTFEIFDPVQPDTGGIGLEQVPDLMALFGHLSEVLTLAR